MPREARNTPSVRESREALRERALYEYNALRLMSYTGGQPDMDKDDIKDIAGLIYDLGTELERAWREIDSSQRIIDQYAGALADRGLL